MDRKGLIEKVMFEERSKENKGMNHVTIWYKWHECAWCWREDEEVPAARAGRAQGEKQKIELEGKGRPRAGKTK